MFFNDFFDIPNDAEHEDEKNESPTNTSPVPILVTGDKKKFEPW